MLRLIHFCILLHWIGSTLEAPVIKPLHEPLNEPGSKDQIIKAWEKEDGMNPYEFDPKLFFLMHDLNADNQLSVEEIDVILEYESQKLRKDDVEANKTYVSNVVKEMREFFMQNYDVDKNGQISIDEFLTSMGHKDQGTKEWTPHEDEIWNETGHVLEGNGKTVSK